MSKAPINYVLTDEDRRGLSVSFGVELDAVPKRVTGGVLDETLTGVMFAETIGGHRIALKFDGRPVLAGSAARLLTGKKRKAA